MTPPGGQEPPGAEQRPYPPEEPTQAEVPWAAAPPPPPPPGNYPPGGGYAAQPYQPSYPVQANKTNGLAVASLICSLAGIVVGISAPVGAILGHMALRQIRQTGEDGEGLAKAGIIVGWIITGLILAACCIGVIAIFAAGSTNNYR